MARVRPWATGTLPAAGRAAELAGPAAARLSSASDPAVLAARTAPRRERRSGMGITETSS
jgi:hypothetical protein